VPLVLAGAAAVALSLGGCGSSAGHAANTHPDSVATTGQARSSAPSAGAGHAGPSTGGTAASAGASTAAAAAAEAAARAHSGGGASAGAGARSSFQAAVNAACSAARSTVAGTTQSTASGGSSLAPSTYQAQRRAFDMLMLTQKLSRLKAPESERASLAELIDSLRQLQHIQLLAANPQATSMTQHEMSLARQRLTASADLAGAPQCASLAVATGVLAASPPGGQPGRPAQPGSQPGSPPQTGPELPRR
jgi:hypothetical protein